MRLRKSGGSHWRVVAAAAAVLLSTGVAVANAATPRTEQESQADQHRRDREELRQLLQKQNDAWARNDGHALAAVFTENGVHVAFDGTLSNGRAQIDRNFTLWFDKYMKGTRLSPDPVAPLTNVRFVGPGVAVMIVGDNCVLWPGETACHPEALSRQTYVAVRENGRWKLSSFQNTRIRNLLPVPGGVAAPVS
ncbi:SgcJ/EcaC family oxidoreductase [Actinocrispum wychmicini]|uniref:Uncharacterized protein (TIGR02246 family) n=1 Tax=Actinocrispum wychmicini TaxID=1213861 RepID=A0A4R2JR35_9PSEU|nr:SgcJ/EcaC family oxidoreductase [Actinocrispum wychmicini]TCO59668.1 uncharacterized protein (TIGR02246 family) [Actinocrispum wychmicini]